MPRIPEDELRRLKEETDLAALIRASGVELSPVGRDLRGKCPFHDDHGPSLVVTPAKELWHCLGACGLGGTAIDWVMKTQGVSFRHAVEILRAKNPAAALLPGVRRVGTTPHLPAPVAPDADDKKLLGQVVEFYHKTLEESPEALAYLESRGLKSPEMVDRFRLGYANRTLGYRLPDSNRKNGGEIRARLTALGIYRESGHEHLAGCVVIPIVEDGIVLGIYGRRIVSDRDRTPRHLYLKGVHKGVWNVEALQAAKEVILCEALIDALSFWCAGLRNVTASYGVHGFTEDHWAAFAKHGVEKLLLAYDGDEAGEKAAQELAPRLAERGIEAWRIHFPPGTDANDALRAGGPERLAELARTATLLVPARKPAPSSSLAAEPALRSLQGEGGPPPPADELRLAFDGRAYRVRGLARNLAYDVLKVSIRVAKGELVHLDTLDLAGARQRAQFVKDAARELGEKAEVVKKDVGAILLAVEELQERRLREALAPKKREVALSEPERAEAMELLMAPDLLERIASDFERIGIVGERTNALVGYLAAVSRKMEEPLALLIQSNSAAGKSTLMEAILDLAPPEDVERFTAMTGQSLFYMAESDLAHRILAIAEVAGAERAGYAIKMLQSEGRISIASPVKDPETGELRTRRHEVEGPVAILMTTTAAAVDEDLANRAIVLTVNEEWEQTRAIHEAQRRRETLEGMLARSERQTILRVHRNAQRLLRPLLVLNPFAERLTFLDTKLRARRDHAKYLTLIRAIALLHQHRRPMKHVERHGKTVPFIEATLADIEIANRLAAEVLGRSLDELAPQTRRLLTLLDGFVRERTKAQAIDRAEFRFTRREVREYAKWGHSQLAVHLERLAELEYLAIHRGGRGQGFVYELMYDGTAHDGGRFLPGLLDVERLSNGYDTNLPACGGHLPGLEGDLPAPFRPGSGPVPGGFRVGGNGVYAVQEAGGGERGKTDPETRV